MATKRKNSTAARIVDLDAADRDLIDHGNQELPAAVLDDDTDVKAAVQPAHNITDEGVALALGGIGATPEDDKAKRSEYRKNYFAKLRNLGPARANAIAARRLSKRIARMMKSVEKWGVADASTALKFASTQLEGAAEAFEALPADWSPPAGAGAPAGTSAKTNTKIVVGAKVDVRESARAAYKGLLDDADFVGLEVLAIAGNGSKLKLKPASGAALVLPRGHVLVAQPPAAQ